MSLRPANRIVIAGGDAYGLQNLLGAFVGLGSINDLMDDELRPLLSQIFTITNKVLRDSPDPLDDFPR